MATSSINPAARQQPVVYKLWGDSRKLKSDGRTVSWRGRHAPNEEIFSKTDNDNQHIVIHLKQTKYINMYGENRLSAGNYAMHYDSSKGYFVFSENKAGCSPIPRDLVDQKVQVYAGDSIVGFYDTVYPENKASQQSSLNNSKKSDDRDAFANSTPSNISRLAKSRQIFAHIGTPMPIVEMEANTNTNLLNANIELNKSDWVLNDSAIKMKNGRLTFTAKSKPLQIQQILKPRDVGEKIVIQLENGYQGLSSGNYLMEYSSEKNTFVFSAQGTIPKDLIGKRVFVGEGDYLLGTLDQVRNVDDLDFTRDADDRVLESASNLAETSQSLDPASLKRNVFSNLTIKQQPIKQSNSNILDFVRQKYDSQTDIATKFAAAQNQDQAASVVASLRGVQRNDVASDKQQVAASLIPQHSSGDELAPMPDLGVIEIAGKEVDFSSLGLKEAELSLADVVLVESAVNFAEQLTKDGMPIGALAQYCDYGYFLGIWSIAEDQNINPRSLIVQAFNGTGFNPDLERFADDKYASHRIPDPVDTKSIIDIVHDLYENSVSSIEISQLDINKIDENLGKGTFAFLKHLSQETKIPLKLIVEQMRQESNLGSNMINKKHRDIRGPLQVCDSTATEVFQRKGTGNYEPDNLRHQIEAGVRYMSTLIKQYKGDLSLALAAYNAGMGNVGKHGGIPPFRETQRYVTEIIERYQGQSTIAYTK